MAPRPVPSAAGLDSADRELAEGVLAGERRALAKAITLIESSRADHQSRAKRLLDALVPHAGNSIRLGVSGAPGVGKSTFIESLGLHVVDDGHRLAVLAIDPSSALTGGSIMGDKTRMERLAKLARAFIRPSPSGGTLGGVAEKTREAMLLCEAAGFDVVFVETVGVGQSEIAVAGMVDMFVLLQLPNAGDELQALKKGIVELADIVAVNKADIDALAAETARLQVQSVLELLAPASPNWRPQALAVSAATGQGIAEFWREVIRYRDVMARTGELSEKRRRQAIDWMWALIDSSLRSDFRHHVGVRGRIASLTEAVARGSVTPARAAHELLDLAKKRE
ncbi:MAG: methylmalonyl Co-A mutase-associated GTPase MeaB [Betaproteobacteria bacterium]|nr:methylmalonyl Co-A mutase-associated GTPase MeaB [Betaproteobacteria bacterium]